MKERNRKIKPVWRSTKERAVLKVEVYKYDKEGSRAKRLV